MTTRNETKYNGLEVGDRVTYSGYPGVVTELCEWSDDLIEVQLESGGLCTDSGEVVLVSKNTN